MGERERETERKGERRREIALGGQARNNTLGYIFWARSGDTRKMLRFQCNLKFSNLRESTSFMSLAI